MADLFKAKNRKGQQLRPGGKAWFPAKTLRWLRRRSEGVDESSVKRKRPVLRQRALAHARRLIGVLEQGGNNSGPEVEQIIRGGYGQPSQRPPWCGYFVAHCYRLAGSKAVDSRWGGVRFLGRIAGTKTLPDVRAGRAGDIVIFDFPGGDAEDHTGLLEFYADGDGNRKHPRNATHVVTIDGNSGGGDISDPSRGGVNRELRPIHQVRRVARVTR